MESLRARTGLRGHTGVGLWGIGSQIASTWTKPGVSKWDERWKYLCLCVWLLFSSLLLAQILWFISQILKLLNLALNKWSRNFILIMTPGAFIAHKTTVILQNNVVWSRSSFPSVANKRVNSLTYFSILADVWSPSGGNLWVWAWVNKVSGMNWWWNTMHCFLKVAL